MAPVSPWMNAVPTTIVTRTKHASMVTVMQTRMMMTMTMMPTFVAVRPALPAVVPVVSSVAAAPSVAATAPIPPAVFDPRLFI